VVGAGPAGVRVDGVPAADVVAGLGLSGGGHVHFR